MKAPVWHRKVDSIRKQYTCDKGHKTIVEVHKDCRIYKHGYDSTTEREDYDQEIDILRAYERKWDYFQGQKIKL